MDSAGSAEQPECGAPWPREGAHAAADGARGYLPFLASFLSFFSFVVSLGLFVFAVRFLSLDMDQEYPAIAREARPQGSSEGPWPLPTRNQHGVASDPNRGSPH